MIRRSLALVGAAVVALATAWLVRGRSGPAGEAPRGDRAAEGVARTPSTAPGPDHDAAEASSPNEPGPAKPRRGLWLLPPDPAAAPRPEHPWLEYIRRRDAVRTAWAAAKITLDLENASLETIQGSLGAAGLVLKIDPDVLAAGRGITFKVGDLDGDHVLRFLSALCGARTTVGADGFMWLVPQEGRAPCEPEFAEELRSTEAGLRHFGHERDDLAGPADELREVLSARRDVQVVRTPLREAMAKLNELYGARLELSIFDDDRDYGSEPVTVIRESATLEEALREALEPLGLELFPNGRRLDLVTKATGEEWRQEQKKSVERRSADAAEMAAIRNRVVRLDGTPLSAEDLLVSAAPQAGVGFRMDPAARAWPERWTAVEAELKFGEVLDAIREASRGEVDFRGAGWPNGREDGQGWVVWVREATGNPPRGAK